MLRTSLIIASYVAAFLWLAHGHLTNSVNLRIYTRYNYFHGSLIVPVIIHHNYVASYSSYHFDTLDPCKDTLQKLKYDIHTKLPLESFQN